jgi:hypothetical protein
VRLVEVLADLSERFHWPPGAWRKMPWVEFQAWAQEYGRRTDEEATAYARAEQEAAMRRQRDEFLNTHGVRPRRR